MTIQQPSSSASDATGSQDASDSQPFNGDSLFDSQGLVPVVAQDAKSGAVLLLAYMNAEALRRTLKDGLLTLWSRSRQTLWRKGETSGHLLRLEELRVNCEGNSLLARVTLTDIGACHEGYRTCFFRRLQRAADGTLSAQVVEPRTFDPAAVYLSEPAPPPRDASLAAAASTPDESDDAALAAALERDARTLYAAYERLRDEDYTATSSTSRFLHNADAESATQTALQRVADELRELRGSIAGTHQHFGDTRDVLLEAGQVGYWAMVAAIAAQRPYDDWEPHRAWLAGWHSSVYAPPAAYQDSRLAESVLALDTAGGLCRTAGIHPAQVVADDLATLRARHPAVVISSSDSPDW